MNRLQFVTLCGVFHALTLNLFSSRCARHHIDILHVDCTVLLDEQVKRDEKGQKLRDATDLLVKTPLDHSKLSTTSLICCATPSREQRELYLCQLPYTVSGLVLNAFKVLNYPHRCPCKCQNVI